MPVYDANGNLKVVGDLASNIDVRESGSVVSPNATFVNFVGEGGTDVSVVTSGSGVTVTVSSSLSAQGSSYNLVVASGSSGQIVTSSANFINFTGPGIESVNISGSGVTVTVTTGSGGGSEPTVSDITVSSGSLGTIVTSSISYINFRGTSVTSVEISGSGVSVNLNNDLVLDRSQVRLIEGFTTSDYYTGSNICPGSTSFSVVWYGLILGALPSAGQGLISRHSSGLGWSLSVGGPDGNLDGGYYLNSYVRDGTGDVSTAAGWRAESLVHYALTYDGSTLRHYINGNIGRFTGPGTGFSPSSNPLQLCMTTVWNEPFTQGGFIGAGYIESVLTQEELQEHLQACKDAGNTFVSNGISWNHYWSTSDLGPDFPEVIQDLTGGSGSLGRVGTAITSTTSRGLNFAVLSASNIPSVAFGDISSTNVQDALEEIRYSSGPLEILSGSGLQVTSSAYFVNFAGSGVESVNVTGSGVTVTIAGGGGASTFTKAGIFMDPIFPTDAVIWRSDGSYTLTNVRGYLSGATPCSASINTRVNTSTNLSSNLFITSSGNWWVGDAPINTAVAEGDSLEIRLLSLSGSVKYVNIQVDLSSS